MNAKTRQTSIDCYYQIKAEGLLSKMRFLYFEGIFNSAPCTSGEAYKAMKMGKTLSGGERLERTRFTELRDMGVIREVGTRKCNVSSRNSIVWDLTDKLPTKLEHTSKKNKVENALNALRKLYVNKDTATDNDWANVANLIKII